MTKQQLIEKKASYELLKTEIVEKSYEAEIEEKLALERKRLEAEYEAQKNIDLQKVDHYLELLSTLICEEMKEEALKLAEETETADSVISQ